MTFLVCPGSLVASGDLINMNATDFTQTHANFAIAPQVPGKSTGSSWNFRLAKGKYVGFENPIYIVNGMIDDSGMSHNNPDTGTTNYHMTGSMLRGLALTGSVVALIDNKIISASPYGEGSLAYCMVKGYNISRNNQTATTNTDVGYLLNYTMDFVEVQI